MNSVNVDRPNDLQVHFIDDSIREAERRRDLISETLRLDKLQRIADILRAHNRHVNTFKHCKEYMNAHTTDHYTLVYVDTARPGGEHIGCLNVPHCDEISILLPNDAPFKRDIILRNVDDSLKSISDLNPKYDSLQYPLYFRTAMIHFI